jgi:hypothetical protein
VVGGTGFSRARRARSALRCFLAWRRCSSRSHNFGLPSRGPSVRLSRDIDPPRWTSQPYARSRKTRKRRCCLRQERGRPALLRCAGGPRRSTVRPAALEDLRARAGQPRSGGHAGVRGSAPRGPRASTRDRSRRGGPLTRSTPTWGRRLSGSSRIDGTVALSKRSSARSKPRASACASMHQR